MVMKQKVNIRGFVGHNFNRIDVNARNIHGKQTTGEFLYITSHQAPNFRFFLSSLSRFKC